MRNGQNKRMRGRNNHRKSHNPMARVYESNGPDVKIRGNPSHIAEKYIQLARDAQSSGDPIAAENYYQHAEHYFRLIAAAQEQFRQSNPQSYRPDNDSRDDARRQLRRRRRRRPAAADGCGRRALRLRHGRTAALSPARCAAFSAAAAAAAAPTSEPRAPTESAGDVDRLPSFITGGAPQQHYQGNQGHGQNGHDNQPDRFPLHRRRRRHRGGPRHDTQGGSHQGPRR